MTHWGVRPRPQDGVAALFHELERIRGTARALDRALGAVVLDRRRPEIRAQASAFAEDLRAAAHRHDAEPYFDEAVQCALDVAAGLPLLGNPFATRVRVRDSGQAVERAFVAELRSRLAAAVAGITPDLSDLDLSGFDWSSRELSQPGTTDLRRLWGVVWTAKTSWPPGLAPRVRARSRELAAGVFRVEPGAPAEPVPVPLPRLTSLDVEFGWRLAENPFVEIDLDAAAVGYGADGSALDGYHVFFNNESSPCGGLRQEREDQNSNTDLIRISFRELDADVRKIDFVLTLYDAHTRRLSFALIEDPYVRLVGPDGAELGGHSPDGLSDGTSAVLASLRKTRRGWFFHPEAREHPGW